DDQLISLRCKRQPDSQTSPLSLHDARPIYAIAGADLGGAHVDATHIALGIADHYPVADLDRALDQQEQARYEVLDDRLQAEANRSGEHTSGLQSREKLVCRPLLQKKNTRYA